MKRFLFVFTSILIIAIMLVLSEFTLGTENINDCIYPVENEGEVLDFGFIKQEYGGNSFLYKKDDFIVGECVKIIGKDKLALICDKLGLRIDRKYSVDGIEIIEGFSAILKYKKDFGNNNVQIAIKNDVITLGTPIIYGSY